MKVEVAKDDKFYINVCGKVGTEPDCKNDAVCRVKDGKAESYGEAGTPNDFIPEGENIKMKYTGRTACDKGYIRLFSNSVYLPLMASKTLYYVFILSAVSPCTAGLKVL